MEIVWTGAMERRDAEAERIYVSSTPERPTVRAKVYRLLEGR